MQTFIATSPMEFVIASIHAQYIGGEVDKDKHKSCSSHPFGTKRHFGQSGFYGKSALIKYEVGAFWAGLVLGI
jgi:hypothetical protein